jgi:hypothetical protein
MVPTPCWERVSITPEDAAPGATWKVYKWVKTDRKQARLPRTLARTFFFRTELCDLALPRCSKRRKSINRSPHFRMSRRSRRTKRIPKTRKILRPVKTHEPFLNCRKRRMIPFRVQLHQNRIRCRFRSNLLHLHPRLQEEESIEVDTEVLTATTTLDPGLGIAEEAEPGRHYAYEHGGPWTGRRTVRGCRGTCCRFRKETICWVVRNLWTRLGILSRMFSPANRTVTRVLLEYLAAARFPSASLERDWIQYVKTQVSDATSTTKVLSSDTLCCIHTAAVQQTTYYKLFTYCICIHPLCIGNCSDGKSTGCDG